MTAATAHRGDSSRHRENTLAAIRSAADAGARTVEVDVHVTRDGQVVLVHDDTLERLWGVDARVAGLDLADVRALGGGDLRIPLLADALELLAGTDVELVIDMASGIRRRGARGPGRPAHAAGRLVRAPRRHAPDPRARPGGRHLAAVGRPQPPTADDLAELRPAVVNMPHLVVGRALVDAVHALGARVAAWTVDEPAQMEWLASIGVDALTTNELATLLDVLARREADPPPRTPARPRPPRSGPGPVPRRATSRRARSTTSARTRSGP